MTLFYLAIPLGVALGALLLRFFGPSFCSHAADASHCAGASDCNCGEGCSCDSKSAVGSSSCKCGEGCMCKTTAAAVTCKCAEGCRCKPGLRAPSCKCGEGCVCGSGSVSKKDIAALVNQGINTLDDLKLALQYAAQLEFSTIPPYLCAEWSVKNQEDPVCNILHEIVVQEMAHMALACNMLTAVGGTPALARKDFVPSYPSNGLPGGVHPGLKVDLLPLSAASVKTFMEIEFPEAGPVALSAEYTTIGAFYEAIAEAFRKLNPVIVNTANQLDMSFLGVFPIKSIEDALKAIDFIREQGEGSGQSPLPPAKYASGEPAHYYAFKQLLVGKRLAKAQDGSWCFEGDAISIPEAHQFSAGDPALSAEFGHILSDLLQALEKVWTVSPSNFRSSMHHMMHLRKAGNQLIANGVRPEFVIR